MFITKKHCREHVPHEAGGANVGYRAERWCRRARAGDDRRPRASRAGMFYLPHGAIMGNTRYGEGNEPTEPGNLWAAIST